jgi:hypothetical protein
LGLSPSLGGTVADSRTNKKLKYSSKKDDMNRPMSSRTATAPAKEKDGSGDEVTALARGLTVLRAIAAADAPLSNRELTELTGIPKPTVSRITLAQVSCSACLTASDSY